MTIIQGWDTSTSRDISEYVFPNISTVLLRPDDLCESPIFLMVIICSAPPNFEARSAVRESWGLERNISDSAVRVYFLLGQTVNSTMQRKIEMEQELYKDIIQESFIDTYNNLTLKSLMLLKLVKNECRNSVSYVMKTDDDMFVNLVQLVKTLLVRNTTRRVLFGNLICHAKPIRDFYDKWYAPEYMYAGKVYPNYLSGTGYVMSADVPEILFETALHTPLLHLEDVYLTGICAKLSHVRPSHNTDFHYKKVKFDPCEYRTLITAHYVKPMEMRQTHFRVHSTDLQGACKVQKAARRNKTVHVTTKYKRTSVKKPRNLCF